MSKKILVVDDDSFFVDLLRDILESAGYQVLQASNASDGLRLIRDERPDIVTLDVMMPERGGLLDGYGLLEEVRADQSCRKLPVIMVSALSENNDIRRAHDLGATDYLPKQNMSPQALLRIMQEQLSGYVSASSDAAAGIETKSK